MNAFATAAVLTALTATALAAPAQKLPSPQTHSIPNAAGNAYEHQGSGLVGSFSDASAKSGTALCQLNRAAMQDPAPSTAFAATAAQDGTIEVALAGLALRKSHNDQVRQFAQKMAEDYARSNTELDAIVKCEGLILPTELDSTRGCLVMHLDAKSDSAFDKAYLAHIGTQHAKATALFESASRSGDPEVAAFARKGLSMLQEHHRLAENLRAAISTKVVSRTSDLTRTRSRAVRLANQTARTGA